MAGTGSIVLAQILPGFREIRGPLASGFLWLVLAWLLFHDNVTSADGAIKELRDLGGAVSDVALAAAASFVAYLIGSVSEDVFGRILKTSVRRYVLDRAWSRDYEPIEPSWHGEQMSDELRQAQITRLENQTDRLGAERDLRIAILPPFVALMLYLAVADSAWWLFGLWSPPC